MRSTVLESVRLWDWSVVLRNRGLKEQGRRIWKGVRGMMERRARHTAGLLETKGKQEGWGEHLSRVEVRGKKKMAKV